MQGYHQIGIASSIPAVAVLAGLLMTVGFCMSSSFTCQLAAESLVCASFLLTELKKNED